MVHHLQNRQHNTLHPQTTIFADYSKNESLGFWLPFLAIEFNWVQLQISLFIPLTSHYSLSLHILLPFPLNSFVFFEYCLLISQYSHSQTLYIFFFFFSYVFLVFTFDAFVLLFARCWIFIINCRLRLFLRPSPPISQGNASFSFSFSLFLLPIFLSVFLICSLIKKV